LVVAFLNSAIVYASLFAFMGMGLTLTYMTTKVPNFAFGSFVTIGVYTAYSMWNLSKANPYLAAAVAFVISGLASVVMYVAILRPLARRGSSLVSLMIATFGVDIGFVGIFGIYTDYLAGRYRLADTKQFFQIQADFSLFGLPGIVLVAPLGIALTTLGLYLLLTRTKFGVAMRASVENPPLSRILGINVERVYVVSWLLAGGFAGVAGALYTLWLPGGTSTGSDLIVEIFAASILGGLTSIFGGALGGLAIGGSEIALGSDLALGFGTAGAAVIGAILALVGVFLWRSKGLGRRIFGVIVLAVGAYVMIDVLAGLPFTSAVFAGSPWDALGLSGAPIDFLAPGLVNGFGQTAIAYQKGIPLLIMVATLLILPQGLMSVEWRKLLRRRTE
jgi:branched-chain amino acid transport system permease protein